MNILVLVYTQYNRILPPGTFGRPKYKLDIKPERIYNPITAMGVSAMFTFQLDNTKSKHCRHPIAIMGIVDTLLMFIDTKL